MIKEFELNNAFLSRGISILTHFWDDLKNTTDDVLVCTLYVLTAIDLDITKPNISTICKKVGIQQSAIIYQIKHKIFERNGIPGFSCIKDSKELIKKVIQARCDKFPVIFNTSNSIKDKIICYNIYLDSTSFGLSLEMENLYLNYGKLMDYIKDQYGNEVKVNTCINTYGEEMPSDILNVQKQYFAALKQLGYTIKKYHILYKPDKDIELISSIFLSNTIIKDIKKYSDVDNNDYVIFCGENKKYKEIDNIMQKDYNKQIKIFSLNELKNKDIITFRSFINEVGGAPNPISKLEYILKNYVPLSDLKLKKES